MKLCIRLRWYVLCACWAASASSALGQSPAVFNDPRTRFASALLNQSELADVQPANPTVAVDFAATTALDRQSLQRILASNAFPSGSDARQVLDTAVQWDADSQARFARLVLTNLDAPTYQSISDRLASGGTWSAADRDAAGKMLGLSLRLQKDNAQQFVRMLLRSAGAGEDHQQPFAEALIHLTGAHDADHADLQAMLAGGSTRDTTQVQKLAGLVWLDRQLNETTRSDLIAQLVEGDAAKLDKSQLAEIVQRRTTLRQLASQAGSGAVDRSAVLLLTDVDVDSQGRAAVLDAVDRGAPTAKECATLQTLAMSAGASSADKSSHPSTIAPRALALSTEDRRTIARVLLADVVLGTDKVADIQSHLEQDTAISPGDAASLHELLGASAVAGGSDPASLAGSSLRGRSLTRTPRPRPWQKPFRQLPIGWP